MLVTVKWYVDFVMSCIQLFSVWTNLFNDVMTKQIHFVFHLTCYNREHCVLFIWHAIALALYLRLKNICTCMK